MDIELAAGLDFAIRAVRKTGDFAGLPVPMQTVLRVHAAQGVIDNGGIEYFFEADFPDTPSYSEFVEAYRTIGAADEADVLEAAVGLFPFANPHKFRDRRNEILDSFNDEEGDRLPASPFNTVTQKLCGNKNVWACLEQYVRTNMEQFGQTHDRV